MYKGSTQRTLIQKHQGGSPMEPMSYIGLDVHKRKLSYCVKDSSGKLPSEGSIPATRFDLDRWMKALPQPWSAAKKRKLRMLPLISFETGRRSQTQSSVQDHSLV